MLCHDVYCRKDRIFFFLNHLFVWEYESLVSGEKYMPDFVKYNINIQSPLACTYKCSGLLLSISKWSKNCRLLCPYVGYMVFKFRILFTKMLQSIWIFELHFSHLRPVSKDRDEENDNE